MFALTEDLELVQGQSQDVPDPELGPDKAIYLAQICQIMIQMLVEVDCLLLLDLVLRHYFQPKPAKVM